MTAQQLARELGESLVVGLPRGGLGRAAGGGTKRARRSGISRNREQALDQRLQIVSANHPTVFARGHEIRGTDGELRVEGSTSHAVIGDDGRPRRIPKEFREAARRVGASPPES